MSNLKRIIVWLLILGGVVAGLYLVGQRQLIGKRASVPTGSVQVKLVPGSQTVGVGEVLPVNINLVPGPDPISAVTLELDYDYPTTAGPALSVASVDANSALLGTGEWSVPIKSFTTSNGRVVIKMALVNSSLTGYLASSEITLATIRFQANSLGSIAVTFNPVESKVFTKEGVDVLTDPTGVVGTYTVGVAATPTPTSTPGPVTFGFKVRLEGITQKAGDQVATVTFRQGGNELRRVVGVPLANDASGVYLGNIPLSVLAGTYDVLVKTGSHLQKRFTNVAVTGTEVNLSGSLASQLKLADVNNTNTLTIDDIALILAKYVDFSVPVPAGTPEDVNADGVITISDIALPLVNYTDFTIAGDN